MIWLLIILAFLVGMYVFGSLCETAPAWDEEPKPKRAGVPGTLAAVAVAAVVLLVRAVA